ncbi:MAG TPA: ATP-binding protein [Vicinamibacterales bacterium]|nr:ATP-binding protein [Vicinamibacterales bacterium]
MIAVRGRLTAWYTSVLAIVVVVYAAATYVAVRREFLEQQEDRPNPEMDEQLGEIRTVLLGGLPFVIGLSAIGGYILAGRALQPVEASFEKLRRFTADASHELRTPLAVIRGTGELALNENRSAGEYKEALGSILEEADRLTGLVDTLLRLSHADAGSVVLAREAVALDDVARDVAGSLAILAEERKQRIVVDAPARVTVTADPAVLREAVINVVDNAIKYSPAGATISVRVRATGQEAELTVADEGPGIAPEFRERIFDRFFRIDEGRSRTVGGAGLGLAIARWAVEVSGGRITATNGARGGAEFSIVLPLSQGGYA